MSASKWKPDRLPVGVMIGGERVIYHDRCIDALGRWFGLLKIGIESEYRFPDVDVWSKALEDKNLLMYCYSKRQGERSFSGRLWLFYKEFDK